MAIAGEIRWELISMQGQVVRSAELVLDGQQNFDLSVEDLPVGLYTLRLEQKNGAAPMTAPLVVVRP